MKKLLIGAVLLFLVSCSYRVDIAEVQATNKDSWNRNQVRAEKIKVDGVTCIVVTGWQNRGSTTPVAITCDWIHSR